MRDRGLDVPDRYWGSYRPGQLLTAYFFIIIYCLVFHCCGPQIFFLLLTLRYGAKYRSIKYRHKEGYGPCCSTVLVFIVIGYYFSVSYLKVLATPSQVVSYVPGSASLDSTVFLSL